MKSFAAPLLALAPLSLAALCPTSHTATFDDLTTNAAVSTYQSISWPGFHVATPSNPLLGTGLPAQSGSKVIQFSATDVQSFSSPALTMYYSGTNVGQFALQSLYLGCVQGGAMGYLPTSCIVQAQGTSASWDNGYRQKNLTFAGGPQMTQYSFVGAGQEDWSALSDLTFSVLGGDGLPSAALTNPTVVVDSVVYTAYTNC